MNQSALTDQCIAIIPARGGSKRIPGKNIKTFSGKPIIAYSIETALQSGLFKRIIVSTDDNRIAGIAKEYGAEVPFMRSQATAGDYATTSEVLVEVIEMLELEQESFHYACCLYPAAPFITPDLLQSAFQLLVDKKFDSVFPVVPFSYPIWRGLSVSDGKAKMIWPENRDKRSQDLMPAYHDAGQFYWFSVNAFKKNLQIFTDNSGIIILKPEQVQDIDTFDDWKLAEIKFSLIQNKS